MASSDRNILSPQIMTPLSSDSYFFTSFIQLLILKSYRSGIVLSIICLAIDRIYFKKKCLRMSQDDGNINARERYGVISVYNGGGGG